MLRFLSLFLWDEKGRKVETVFITESEVIILQDIGISVG